MVANNHNLFPLPYWAPALWRVPIPLQHLNEAYAAGAAHKPDGLCTTQEMRNGCMSTIRRPPGEDAAHDVHGAPRD